MESLQQTNSPRKKRTLLAIAYSFIYLLIIGYLDIAVLTPAILPEDECYYHFHDIPFWVDFFYMSGANNGHPSTSFPHLIVLLLVSILLGYITNRAFVKRQDQKQNWPR